jgi:hypothetical protein
MDDAGYVTFEGAEPTIEIMSMTIAGGQTIDTDNGTVQLTATLNPTDATQAYIWVVTEGAKIATVDKMVW